MGKPLNIVFISTWHPAHCGLAAYCSDLSQALTTLGHNVYVLSELSSDLPITYDISGIKHFPCWSRRGSLEVIYRTIKSSTVRPDIITWNHELGLFPNTEDLVHVTQKLSAEGYKQVIIYHTVSDEFDFSRIAATPIVHTPAAALLCSNATVIPHGITFRAELSKVQKLSFKESINFEDKTKYTALIPGFIVENKRTLEIALAILQNTDHNIIVSGEIKDEKYGEWLIARINASGRQNRIKLDYIYADDKKRDLYFRAADYVVLGRRGPGLGSKGTPHSASGQMATAIGYNLPIFAQYSQIHLDHGGAALLYFDENELVGLLRGITDKNLAEMSNRCSGLLDRDWAQIAKRHERVYES